MLRSLFVRVLKNIPFVGRWCRSIQTFREIVALQKQANLLHEQAKYAEAAALSRRALTLAEQLFDFDDSYHIVQLLVCLAEYYRVQGHNAEAEQLLKRALTTANNLLLFKAHHLLLARTLESLAYLYQEQNRTIEAERLWKRAIAI